MQSDFFKYFLFGVAALLVFMLLREWNSFSSAYEKQISPTKHSVNEEVYSVEEDLGGSYIEDKNILSGAPNTSKIKKTNNNLTQYVKAETDSLRVTIDKRGGDIVKVELLKHKKSLDEPSLPFVLLEKDTRNYYARSGIQKPNDNTKRFYSSDQNYYKLEDGEELSFNLSYTEAGGVELIKRFTLKKNDYLIDVDHYIKNNNSVEWSGFFFANIIRDASHLQTYHHPSKCEQPV